uniref:Uncharacterized protein n=1 Tax=Chelydra serpentina TaxID=8475 RepID=A0A8C3XVE4_CHESE
MNGEIEENIFHSREREGESWTFPIINKVSLISPSGESTDHRASDAFTRHPIDIAHSSLELLSDPPTAASQVAGITDTWTHHHTGVSICFTFLSRVRQGGECMRVVCLCTQGCPLNPPETSQ